MTTDAVGGVWNHSLDLARALQTLDTEVVLAVTGPAPSADRLRQAQAAGVTPVVVPGPLEWMETTAEGLDALERRLLALADEHRPDVVHLNAYAHAAAGWRVPVVVGAHSTKHGWWEAVHDDPPPEAWETYRERVEEGLAAADHVVAPTGAVLNELRRHYGLGRPASVIANGHDGTPTDRVEAPEEGGPILWSGRAWDEAKNLAGLDAVAGKTTCTIEAAGSTEGPDGQRAPQVRHVRLLGHVPEAAYRERLMHASVYVSTAHYEPFGLGPLEAARAGCALVLSDLTSLREVWGDAAHYADPRDPEAFHDTLEAVHHDHTTARRSASAARERASRYTTRRMALRYRSLYARLMREASKADPTSHSMTEPRPQEEPASAP